MSTQTLEISLSVSVQQSRDLLRFNETTEDGQGYDVPRERMKVLAQAGYIRSLGFSRYEFTDVGTTVLERLRTNGAGQVREPVNPYLELNFLGIGFRFDPSAGQTIIATISTPEALRPITKAAFWQDVMRHSLAAVVLAHKLRDGVAEIPVPDMIQSLSDLDHLRELINSAHRASPDATVEVEWLSSYLKFWHDEDEQVWRSKQYQHLHQGIAAKFAEQSPAAS